MYFISTLVETTRDLLPFCKYYPVPVICLATKI